jgi:hypothetical protein
VLLIANTFDGYQAASAQTGQFPLHRSRPGIQPPENFRRVEAAIRVPKNERKDAPLHVREQRVRDAYGVDFGDTHIGEDITQIGELSTHAGMPK